MSDLQFGPLLKTYFAAAKAVWEDFGVWAEEQRSTETRLMQFPRELKGTVYEELKAELFNSEVRTVVRWLSLLEPAGIQIPNFPPQLTDPELQVLLRVVHRSWLAGTERVEAEFAGERITGRNEFKDEWRRDVVDFIQRSGMRESMGDEAYKVFGIGRSSAFRKMKLKRR